MQSPGGKDFIVMKHASSLLSNLSVWAKFVLQKKTKQKSFMYSSNTYPSNLNIITNLAQLKEKP